MKTYKNFKESVINTPKDISHLTKLATGGRSYEDTEEGVKSMLKRETTYDHDDIHSAEYTPDPQVHGAWKVKMKNATTIAYVGSHPDAPDHEEVEEK